MISMLLPVRKNSKFFSKWIITYMAHTRSLNYSFNPYTELIIMASQEDTWNRDIFNYYHLNVVYENKNVGHEGRYMFWNDMAKLAKGDWLWYVCDDHYLYDGYDEKLHRFIEDNKISSKEINCIIPRVENSGWITHIISRKWYETLGHFGLHGNIDSYINRTIERMIIRKIHLMNDPILYDYTLDNPMTPEHSSITIDKDFISYPFGSKEVEANIDDDARKLYQEILKEHGTI